MKHHPDHHSFYFFSLEYCIPTVHSIVPREVVAITRDVVPQFSYTMRKAQHILTTFVPSSPVKVDLHDRKTYWLYSARIVVFFSAFGAEKKLMV